MRASPPRGLLVAFPTVAVVAVVAASCASHDDAAAISVEPSLILPRGLLDTVTSLGVAVYDQTPGIGCDAATGRPTGLAASATPLTSAALGSSGCAAGARFCGALTIAKSQTPRLFVAVGKDAAGAELADGCTSATIADDVVPVPIRMVRYVPADRCGDGTVGPTEQCEPAGAASDPVCDASCHTKELRLSDPGVAARDVTFLWPAQSGDAGRFFAFFTAALANDEIAMRVRSDAFGRVTTPPEASDAELVLPNDPAVFPPQVTPADQSEPAAARLGASTYVAFTDTAGGTPDIHLRSFDASLKAEQGPAAITVFDGDGTQRAPSIAAGANGALFIAWQDETGADAGQVLGRTYTPSFGLGAIVHLSSGAQNQNVKVAATPTGWAAVWESGTDVKLRVVDGSGTPSGAELVVNHATPHGASAPHRPVIAVLGDGRVAVAWTDGGSGADVYVQRYDKDLVEVAGDQSARVNDVIFDKDQTTPAIAASAGAGGSFVMAWLDVASQAVRARLLGGSGGFLFNNVNGQNGEFAATLATGRTRANPAVASGGTGFIAIGWEDHTTDAGAGVYARRFPLATQ